MGPIARRPAAIAGRQGRLCAETPFAVGLDARGLRAALFLAPRGAAAPTPWQLLVLSLISAALLVGPPGGRWWALRSSACGVGLHPCGAAWCCCGWHGGPWRPHSEPGLVNEGGFPWPFRRIGGLVCVVSVGPSGGHLLVLYVLMGMAVHQPGWWSGAVASIVFWSCLWRAHCVGASRPGGCERTLHPLPDVRTAVFGLAMAAVVGDGRGSSVPALGEDAQALADASAQSADGAPPPEPAHLTLSQGPV